MLVAAYVAPYACPSANAAVCLWGVLCTLQYTPYTMIGVYGAIVALWAAGLGYTYYSQNGYGVNQPLPDKPAIVSGAGAAGGDGITVPPFLMGAWDYRYTNLNNTWTADDFIVKADNGKESVWQNFILTFSKFDYEYAAQVYTQVYNRTGYKLFIFWGVGAITDLPTVQNITLTYANLTQYYPLLPPQPAGFFLYDEPSNPTMDGSSTAFGLVNLTQALKQVFPTSYIYANFLVTTTQDPNYAALIGNSSLDFVGMDSYGQTGAQAKAELQQNFYPYLKPTQKVLGVPNAAYGAGNSLSTVLDPVIADLTSLYTTKASATSYYQWMQTDSRVVGFTIYRLKNVWSSSYNGTTLNGNVQDGIGLVDRVTPGGPYIMPNTVRFYQTLGVKWTYSGTK